MFNTEKAQYKTATLYSSVFSYSLCCFLHAKNNCSATWWPKGKELKKTQQQHFTLPPEGTEGCNNMHTKWKPSRLILVPLPTPATKETSRTAQRKGWRGKRGARAPGKPWTCLCLRMRSERKSSAPSCGLHTTWVRNRQPARATFHEPAYSGPTKPAGRMKHSLADVFKKQFGCEALQTVTKSRCACMVAASWEPHGHQTSFDLEF